MLTKSTNNIWFLPNVSNNIPGRGVSQYSSHYLMFSFVDLRSIQKVQESHLCVVSSGSMLLTLSSYRSRILSRYGFKVQTELWLKSNSIHGTAVHIVRTNSRYFPTLHSVAELLLCSINTVGPEWLSEKNQKENKLKQSTQKSRRHG